ncbi:ELP4 isoform 29 [Pan troglodytes]|uniref:ELP4 isoform 29 n=2 Tax=Pan troglodytes TaxID=9598 RepID=A0A6D2WK78_PANTR|nr:ELP4 isoform 29 [Pan troglodytes]
MAAAATCGSVAASTGSAVATASKNNVTSFQRRGRRASGTNDSGPRLVSITGTRPSVRNGQLLVSTGLPALDQLLGPSRFRPACESFYNCERQTSLEDAGKK